MRVVVDPALCQGHTLCNMAAPDLIHLRDDDGHAYVVVEGDLTPEQAVLAERAVAGCPERAIRLEE